MSSIFEKCDSCASSEKVGCETCEFTGLKGGKQANKEREAYIKREYEKHIENYKNENNSF